VSKLSVSASMHFPITLYNMSQGFKNDFFILELGCTYSKIKVILDKYFSIKPLR